MAQKRKRRLTSKPVSLLLLDETPLNKKPHYEFQIHWNSDIEISQEDKYILNEITHNIDNSFVESLNLGIRIYQNIAEFALGSIAKCPSCNYGEILVIQSSLENFVDSLNGMFS